MDVAAESACDGAADGQSQSDAFLEGVEFDEALEDDFRLLGVDAWAVVLDGNEQVEVVGLGTDEDVSTLGRNVFLGVFEQSTKHALQHALMAVDGEVVREL